MQVLIELDDDQIEDVLVSGLKRNYEIHLNMREPEDHHVHEAFQIMLAYFMSERDYEKYMKGLSPLHNKYSAKRLAEANNGL
jgi:hypothetical protein